MKYLISDTIKNLFTLWRIIVILIVIPINGICISSSLLAENGTPLIPGKIIFYAYDTSKIRSSFEMSLSESAVGIKPTISSYKDILLTYREEPKLSNILGSAKSQSLSPDSTQVLLTIGNRINKNHARLSDIFVLDIKSGISYQLTSTGHNICPVWSPDGKKIAFYRGDETIPGNDLYLPGTKGFALAIMNRDGTNLKEIVSDGYLFAIYYDYPPQWSPSGNEILFSYKIGSTTYDWGTYLVHIDGSGLKMLKQSSDEASWSPSGKQIAMTVYYGSEGSKIHIMDPTGANEIILDSEAKYNERPIWSPDGKWITFIASGLNMRKHLIFINLDNGQKYTNIIPSELHIQSKPGIKWLP